MFYIFIVLILMMHVFDIDVITLKNHSWKGIKLLRATRGARNRNLLVVISHSSHVCSHHLFALPLRRNRNAQKLIWSRVFRPSVTWNLRKAQRWSKSVWTSLGPSIIVARSPQPLVITSCYYRRVALSHYMVLSGWNLFGSSWRSYFTKSHL